MFGVLALLDGPPAPPGWITSPGSRLSEGSWVMNEGNVSSLVMDRPRLSLFIEFPRLRPRGTVSSAAAGGASSAMVLCLG